MTLGFHLIFLVVEGKISDYIFYEVIYIIRLYILLDI